MVTKTGSSDARAIHSPQALVDAGLVSEDNMAAVEATAARYAVSLTPAVHALIDRGDPDDPIARQFVPSAHELLDASNEVGDPIGDQAFSPVEGIVHRYRDRVLLMPTHTCATYCRYCFRRERVGDVVGDLVDEFLHRLQPFAENDPRLRRPQPLEGLP